MAIDCQENNGCLKSQDLKKIELNILNPAFLLLWKYFLHHSTMMNFEILKDILLIRYNLYRFECKTSDIISFKDFSGPKIKRSRIISRFIISTCTTECRKSVSKPYKDVSNKTKSYHGQTFSLFRFKIWIDSINILTFQSTIIFQTYKSIGWWHVTLRTSTSRKESDGFQNKIELPMVGRFFKSLNIIKIQLWHTEFLLMDVSKEMWLACNKRNFESEPTHAIKNVSSAYLVPLGTSILVSEKI